MFAHLERGGAEVGEGHVGGNLGGVGRLGFRAGLGFRVRVQGSGFGFRVHGSGFGFGVQGPGFGFRVQGTLNPEP